MPVTPISKVVTANDLKSGEVIYLRFPHSWTPDLTKASVITDVIWPRQAWSLPKGKPMSSSAPI